MKKKGLKEYIVISNKNGKLFMLKPSYSKKYLSPSKLKWLVFLKINIETKKMSRIKLSQLETIFNHALQ